VSVVVVSVGVTGAVEPVPGVDTAVTVVTGGDTVATVSFAIVKRNVELPPLCPSGCVTSQETAHSPLGSGFGTETLSETPSTPTCGVPTAIGAELQTTSTVLVAPSGAANVSRSEAGEASTVVPAAGDDDTSVLSAASACGTARVPTTAMPTMVAGPRTAMARLMARMGEGSLFMQVTQR
jgi:hypothetical protein